MNDHCICNAVLFFFSSRRRHTRLQGDWSSDVCSSDLLLAALYAERRALFGCLVILLGATLVASTVMHLIERHAQPDKFGTIPDAMWWAVITLGTIGYGDVVPVTALGKVVAAGTVFLGVIIIDVPVGVLAAAFDEGV